MNVVTGSQEDCPRKEDGSSAARDVFTGRTRVRD